MRRAAALLAASVAVALPLRAQSFDAAAAYIAINSTPVGLLSRPLSSQMLGADQRRLGVFGTYGRLDDPGGALNAYGAGIDFAFGIGRFSALVGSRSCDDCEATVMFGAAWQGRTYSSLARGADPAPAVNIGLDAHGGVAIPTSGNSGSDLAFGFGLPIAYAVPMSGANVAPWLLPSVDFGRLTRNGSTYADARFALGGGLTYLRSAGFGVQVGFYKLFVENGKTTATIALEWAPPIR